MPSDCPRKIARKHVELSSKQSRHSSLGLGWLFVQGEIMYLVSWSCFANFEQSCNNSRRWLEVHHVYIRKIDFTTNLNHQTNRRFKMTQTQIHTESHPHIWEAVTMTMMSHCSPSKSIPSTPNFWSITRGKRVKHLNGLSSAWFLML